MRKCFYVFLVSIFMLSCKVNIDNQKNDSTVYDVASDECNFDQLDEIATVDFVIDENDKSDKCDIFDNVFLDSENDYKDINNETSDQQNIETIDAYNNVEVEVVINDVAVEEVINDVAVEETELSCENFKCDEGYECVCSAFEGHDYSCECVQTVIQDPCDLVECQIGYNCENGICICVPSCEDMECGPDGCGGLCGMCDEFQNSFCNINFICDCVPQCDNKECGDGGCGLYSCGNCFNANDMFPKCCNINFECVLCD